MSALCNPDTVRALGFNEPIRCETRGVAILHQLNIYTAKGWKWAGVGFLIGAAHARSQPFLLCVQ